MLRKLGQNHPKPNTVVHKTTRSLPSDLVQDLFVFAVVGDVHFFIPLKIGAGSSA